MKVLEDKPHHLTVQSIRTHSRRSLNDIHTLSNQTPHSTLCFWRRIPDVVSPDLSHPLPVRKSYSTSSADTLWARCLVTWAIIPIMHVSSSDTILLHPMYFTHTFHTATKPVFPFPWLAPSDIYDITSADTATPCNV